MEGDFGAGRDGRVAGEPKNKGPDYNLGQMGGHRTQVIQLTQVRPVRQRNSNFLKRFPQGGRPQIRIISMPSPTGEGQMPGPRITGKLGTLDEQDIETAGRAGRENERDRGLCLGRKRICSLGRACGQAPSDLLKSVAERGHFFVLRVTKGAGNDGRAMNSEGAYLLRSPLS
jgi:hypothetical protein